MIPAEVVQDLLGLVLVKHIGPVDLVPDAVAIPSARDANAGRRRSGECRVVDAGRPGDCGGEYSTLPALKDTRISGGMSVLIKRFSPVRRRCPIRPAARSPPSRTCTRPTGTRPSPQRSSWPGWPGSRLLCRQIQEYVDG